MLTDGPTFRGARLPAAVLDDVASHAGRLHPHTETREGSIPDDDVLNIGCDSLDDCLAVK